MEKDRDRDSRKVSKRNTRTGAVLAYLRWETLYLVHTILVDGCVKVNEKREERKRVERDRLYIKEDHVGRAIRDP